VKAAGSRASGTRLLAAVVLSACVGVIGGGLGAWGVYSHFGPVERVITQTSTGGGAVSVGDIATAVLPSLVTISTQAVTPGDLATGSATGLTEGFAVSSDGLIVTSAHAVRGATRLRVAAADGKGYDATIAASDIVDGIARRLLPDWWLLLITGLGASLDLAEPFERAPLRREGE